MKINFKLVNSWIKIVMSVKKIKNIKIIYFTHPTRRLHIPDGKIPDKKTEQQLDCSYRE